jgi:hypothetical protein
MPANETATRFELVIKKGTAEVGRIEGAENIPLKAITLADMNHVIAAEQFLEKLTGYRFHINQIPPR